MGQAPQVTFNIKDEFPINAATTPVYPLYKPMYALKSQKGLPGLFYYETYAQAEKALGKETFNELNLTYFSPASMFVKAAMEHAGCWIYRLIPDDARSAQLAIFATIEEGPVPVYRKSELTGERLVDENGDWIPVLIGDNRPDTIMGYIVTWTVENLVDGDEFDKLTPHEYIDVEFAKTKFPIIGFKAKSVGEGGNGLGFEIYYDDSQNTVTNIINTNSIINTFRFKERSYNLSSVDFIRDDTGATEIYGSIIDGTVNKTTNLNVSITDLLDSRYTGSNEFPMEVHTYSENLQLMQNLFSTVLSFSEQNSIPEECVNGFITNFFTGVNPFTGYEYDAMVVVNNFAKKNVTNYLNYGDDGTLSWANENIMVQQLLSLDSFPDLEDEARYPINSIVDVGYLMETKYAMIDFMDIRKDVNVVVSPYQHGLPELTQAEEFSVGAALRTRSLLIQESTLYATEACRACIMLQSGVPVTSVKNLTVPGSYWVAKQLAKTYNGTYLGNPMLTWPYSINDLFKKLNWYPIKLDYKNKLYSSGLNYTQWLDANVLHVAALRTVYPNDASKLVDFPFVVVCGFIRQLVRYIGMKFTGTELPKNIRHYYIKNEIEGALTNMLNGQYFPEVSISQTAEEEALGYIDHVYINMPVDKSMTLLAVDLIVKKPTSN